jgi:2-polyprenyl-6-hydroxyphenyl methylase / 3-demethylubiquinone-9 3-methyltransferase
MATPLQSSVDETELAKFSAIAAQWWDPAGKFAVLHKFNPVRLAYIREQAAAWLGLDPVALRPFKGLRLLDIGCGGGLLSEPMARLGADVVGIDPAERNILTARVHAADSELAIDYRVGTAEELAAAGETFDIILNMEVVEHVRHPDRFLAECARMLRPRGVMIVATINRTFRSFALAIVGAEYVLGWLPKGTHQWEKFVTPEELAAWLEAAGLSVRATDGVIFNPLTASWSRSADCAVNYMVVAQKHKAMGNRQ